MGKVVVAVMGAFGLGAFATTFLGSLVGPQAEVAALGIAGSGLLAASQLMTRRVTSRAADNSLKDTVPAGARVPA